MDLVLKSIHNNKTRTVAVLWSKTCSNPAEKATSKPQYLAVTLAASHHCVSVFKGQTMLVENTTVHQHLCTADAISATDITDRT